MRGCPSGANRPQWRGRPSLSWVGEDGEGEGEESGPVVGVVES